MLEKRNGRGATWEVAGRPLEGAVGDRKRTTGGLGGAAPDPELVEGARRRRFTAEYKLGVLREADGCSAPGEIGALLRRERLYSSHLSTWPTQRDQGALPALPTFRGRKQSHPPHADHEQLPPRAPRHEAGPPTGRGAGARPG